MRSLILKIGIYYCAIFIAAGSLTAHIQAQNDKPKPEILAMQAIASSPTALLSPPPIPPPPPQAAAAPSGGPLQPAQPPQLQAPAPLRLPPASTAGNPYARGNCTWYAKSRRPDMPNNLGNANTWVARARAQGIPTGLTPKAGAIAQRGWHVVYIERVNGDGTVFLSEMNYRGLGIVSTRTVPANSFQYIY